MNLLADIRDIWRLVVLVSSGHVLVFVAATVFLARNVIAADVARSTLAGLSSVFVALQQCWSCTSFSSPFLSHTPNMR